MKNELEDRYGLSFIPGPWFEYENEGSSGYCQTDGILLNESRRIILIVEVKYKHTPEAYWQLENLYLPVARVFFRESSWQLATVEVVKWFDPSTSCPKRPILQDDLEQVRPGQFAVHILNR